MKAFYSERFINLMVGGMMMRLLKAIICCTLAALTFSVQGLVSPAYGAEATNPVMELITAYEPQVVGTETEASYVDGAGNTVIATFQHPGIAVNQSGLDNMRDHVRAGDEPWLTAFEALANDVHARKNPRIYYEAGNNIFVHVMGPWAFTDEQGRYWANPSDYVGTRANTDSLIAFKQAIMWYITGDESYRQNAMYIIRSYANIESAVPHRNFRFATVTYLLAAAAEIMKYSDTPSESLKWTEADTANLSNAMELLRVTYDPHTYFMNQHQFNVMGIMGKAIFTDDLELYAEAVEAATVNQAGEQGGRNGSIMQTMRYMTHNEVTGEPLDPAQYHVQLMEMGRDVGHSYASLGGLMTLAQTIYTQGTLLDPVNGTISNEADAVNVFHFMDERLLAGTNYILKYHLGFDVPWTPAYGDGTVVYDRINSDLRGRIDPYLSVIYNYYKYIEQQDMTQEKLKYLAYVYETRFPVIAGKDYPLLSLLYMPDEAKQNMNRIVLDYIQHITATALSAQEIEIAWSAVPHALGYTIERSTTANGPFTKLVAEPLANPAFTDTSLQPNTTYYYKVSVAGGAATAPVFATTAGSAVPQLLLDKVELQVNHKHQTELQIIHSAHNSEDVTPLAQYSSSDPDVASVDASGVVTARHIGAATITATYLGTQYQTEVNVIVDAALRAWYPFDEHDGAAVADSSGFNQHGTVIGPSNTAWVAGQYGNALQFNGVNTAAAYVQLPDHLVDELESMTFTAWVNASNTSDAISLFTAGPLAEGAPAKYMMILLNGSRFMITTNGNRGEQSIRGGSNVTANQWKHIAVTLSGNTGILYIDGAQAAINTDMSLKPSDLAPTEGGNFIGRSAFAADRYLKGKIDDFRLYNRALQPAEIEQVMNGVMIVALLDAPIVGKAITQSNSSAQLQWNPVTGASGYNVYAVDSLASNAGYTKLNDALITDAGLLAGGLAGNSTHYFKVTAVNEAGESRMSAFIEAKTAADHDPRLIALYKLDAAVGKQADDASGNQLNGTIYGAAQWEAGKRKEALRLNGADSYVGLPLQQTTQAQHWTATNELTIAAWINWSGGAAWQRIFDFGNNTSQYMFLTPRSADQTMRFAVRYDGVEQFIDTAVLPANEWAHIAVTFGGGTAKIYVDGVLAATKDDFTIEPNDLAASTYYIGKSFWNDPLLGGLIDEFSIYNTVLAEAEIAELVNGAEQADTTALAALIATAQDLYNRAQAGTKLGQYASEAKATLAGAIQAADAITASSPVAEYEVEQALTALTQAIQLFRSQIITMNEAQATVSISDLAIVSQYLGVTSEDERWQEVEQADVNETGQIDGATLKAIARIILIEWVNQWALEENRRN
jgi:hypothetical protein